MATRLAVLVLASMGWAADWPQWQGSDRNDMSTETGLLKEWPKDGPKFLWVEKGLEKGYSTVSVANGLIFTTGMDEDKKGILFVHDLDGNLKWQSTYGLAWSGSYPSARSTLTIDGDRDYVMSGQGMLVCFNLKTRKISWPIDTIKRFGGKGPTSGLLSLS